MAGLCRRLFRLGRARQRKATVEKDRERKGIAEGRGGGEGGEGDIGRRGRVKRSPRGLKKKRRRKREGKRFTPRVPQQRGCSNVTVAEELTRQGSSRRGEHVCLCEYPYLLFIHLLYL